MDPLPLRILVVGHGGRETAICRALTTASACPELLIAPGNAGTAAFGQNVPIQDGDIDALVGLAMREGVDLVLPGPELPLAKGLADRLAERGLPCCGPTQAAARLETSKSFARQLAARLGVPGPRFVTSRDARTLADAIDAWDGIPVVKADGLASGKGVFLPATKEECLAATRRLLDGALGEAGLEVVLEERLSGSEASLFFACDGATALALPNARDYKRLGDHDVGPNTGGMGAFSPHPLVTPELELAITESMVRPVLHELVRLGTPFRGFLYVGVMLTAGGPRLLEYNVRLGDPEAEVILPRLAGENFADLCAAMGRGELASSTVRINRSATCAVVLAAPGYPDEPRIGATVDIDDCEAHDCWLDIGGATMHGAALVTCGGRVAAAVARASDLTSARALAYGAASHVRFPGLQLRRDIAEGCA
jgi:phosphoribosylamine---glycine ligase